MSNCLGKVGIIWNRGSDIYYEQYYSKATIWIIRSTITGHHYSTSRTRYLYHLYIFLSILSIYLFIYIIYIIYIVIYLIYISLSSLSIYFCYISYLYIVIYLIYISLRSKKVWVMPTLHQLINTRSTDYWYLLIPLLTVLIQVRLKVLIQDEKCWNDAEKVPLKPNICKKERYISGKRGYTLKKWC